MSLKLLKFQPGVVKDITAYAAGKVGPYYIDSDKVRFRDGYPTKIGGWVKEEMYGVNTASEADYSTTKTLDGVARNVAFWRSLSDGEDYMAIGTHSHLYILENEALFDITPLRATQAGLSNPFATTDGSSVITVTDASHGASAGDYVVFSGASAFNGIAANTLNSYFGYEITEVVNPNSYKVDVGTNANAASSGGGTVTAKYLIGLAAGLGTQTSASALGWGAGGWGDSTWGTPRTASATDVVLENSQWSLNLWGEDLIATVRNGAIYYWDTSAGVGSRAVLVSGLGGAADVPPENRVSTISFPDRHLVCGGTTPLGGSDIDPMLVRWSNQEDFKDWSVTATNTAGDQRLEVGTKIVAMQATRDETFIATDDAIYGMNFIGPPFTFSFRLLGTICGAISKNCMANVDGDIFWMSDRGFFFYDGSVKEIPCPVLHFVLDRVQLNKSEKIFVGTNKEFNEVAWYYVSTSNTDPDAEPDSYVTYNYRDAAWTVGTLDRTVWADSSGFRQVPFAFSKEGELYEHETGVDDDGSAMTAFITTSDVEISETGDSLAMVDKIIPDAVVSGSINMTVETQKYPNSTVISKGPFTISQNSNKISMRARGRQMSFKFESSAVGDDWRLGDFRINARTDGIR